MEAAERLLVRPLLEGKYALGKQLMSMGVHKIVLETKVRARKVRM